MKKNIPIHNSPEWTNRCKAESQISCIFSSCVNVGHRTNVQVSQLGKTSVTSDGQSAAIVDVKLVIASAPEIQIQILTAFKHLANYCNVLPPL